MQIEKEQRKKRSSRESEILESNAEAKTLRREVILYVVRKHRG